MPYTQKKLEDLKDKILNSDNLVEVKKIEEAEQLLILYKDKNICKIKDIEEDTNEETVKLIEESNNAKVYYVNDLGRKINKKSKKEQMKIENFKKKIIRNIPELIEVKEMKDAEIVLIIHNDFTQWDVRENDHPNPRFLKKIKEAFDLSFYWLKRVNKQNNIKDILHHIDKNIRKK